MAVVGGAIAVVAVVVPWQWEVLGRLVVWLSIPLVVVPLILVLVVVMFFVALLYLPSLSQFCPVCCCPSL